MHFNWVEVIGGDVVNWTSSQVLRVKFGIHPAGAAFNYRAITLW